MSSPEPAPPPQDAPRGGWSGHIWVSSTYFAEGFPYGIVHNFVDPLFLAMGTSLEALGLTSLLHLPWNLKFLWGPLLDRFGSLRTWLLGTEWVLGAILGIAAIVAGGWSDSGAITALLAVLFTFVSFAAATHDVAIDGFYMAALDKDGQSKFVGYRAAAYRLGALLAKGPALVLAGWAGWMWGLLGLAAVMVLLALLHAAALPRVQRGPKTFLDLVAGLRRPKVLITFAVAVFLVWGQHRFGWFDPLRNAVTSLSFRFPWFAKISLPAWISLGLLAALIVLLVLLQPLRRWLAKSEMPYAEAFVDFMDQPRILVMLAFVLTFRVGETALTKMTWPFFRATGMPLEDYAWANGTLGTLATIVATIAGGWAIGRYGLRKLIWPFVLAQNLLNLLYVWLVSQADPFWWATPWAGGHPGFPPLAGISTFTATAVIAAEHFGEGLGTAVFVVYILRCCNPRFKAAHMAIVTALMSVGVTIMGVSSGVLVEQLGFGRYFGFSFTACIPMMLLIFVIPHLDGREGDGEGDGNGDGGPAPDAAEPEADVPKTDEP